MRIARAAALSAWLVACGGDDDPKVQHDASIGVDAKVCTAVTLTGTDVLDEDAGQSIAFSGSIGEIDGFPTYLRMEFRHTASQIVLPPTIELGAGVNASYATCFACLVATSIDPATGAEVAHYFQESGTLTLSADPITERHLTATVTDLTLQKASASLELDPAGECLSMSGTVDQDNVPNAWTCTGTDYYGLEGNDCHCGCGVYDPDCRVPTVATTGCSGGTPVCVPTDTGTTCVAAAMYDTCADAPTVSPGSSASPNVINGTTVGAKHHYDRGLEGCTGSTKPGPDVVYRMVLTQGVAYTIALTGLSHDGSFALVGPTTDAGQCSANITGCVAGRDAAGAGSNEVLSFTPATTGQYFFIIDSHDPDGAGTFMFSVTAP